MCRPECDSARSITELPVLVLAEECGPDGGQGVAFEQPQSLLERVVDIDLSTGAYDDGTSGAAAG